MVARDPAQKPPKSRDKDKIKDPAQCPGHERPNQPEAER